MNGKVNLFANAKALPLPKAPNSPPPHVGGYNAGLRCPEATLWRQRGRRGLHSSEYRLDRNYDLGQSWVVIMNYSRSLTDSLRALQGPPTCALLTFAPVFRLVICLLAIFSALVARAQTFSVAAYNVETYLDQPTESRQRVKSDEAKAKVRESILYIRA